jgi:hypothetical protein
VLLTILAAASIHAVATVVPAAGADSLDAIKHVDYLLSQYYPLAGGALFRSPRRSAYGGSYASRCDADLGDVCFADDPDAGGCPDFVQCHRSPDHMIDVMVRATKEYPASGYLAGQAVYALTKQDRLPEAMKVADSCAASGWWCDALRGYVLHAQGKDIEADSVFHTALRAAPDSVVCAWPDATWLLGSWAQRGSQFTTVAAHDAASGWSCARRMAVSDSIWWLADPLYSVRGNDRWVEHLTRHMATRFYDEIRRTHAGSLGPENAQQYLWASRIRRGAVDSYDLGEGYTWTSQEGARYHFVPDVQADDLADPVWRLEAHLDDEGYTPPYGPVLPIPHQTARFRRADTLRIAVATRLEGTPLNGALDAAASFVLSGGPDRAPVILTADPHQPTVRFLGSAPARRYAASLEVVTSKGVGWDRRTLAPLPAEGSAVSDLLLYRASGVKEPSTLEAATRLMDGSTTVTKGATVGVYWETYGLPAQTTLTFDLSVERRAGGLVGRLRGLLPGGNQEGPGRIVWTEPATGMTHSSAVALDLRALDGGDYTLVLRVGWAGQAPLERRRDITVE